MRMPLSKSLDAPADLAEEERVESLEEARLLGEDHGVVVRGSDRSGSLDRGGDRRQATEQNVDLIVLGSAPRWRRQLALLLAHCRARPAQRAVRGARRRLPEHVLEEDG